MEAHRFQIKPVPFKERVFSEKTWKGKTDRYFYEAVQSWAGAFPHTIYGKSIQPLPSGK